MLETLITVIVMLFVSLMLITLITAYILLAVENYTKYKPIEWLIDKAMRSH